MTTHPIVIANWKMHQDMAGAHILAERVRNGCENIAHIEVVLCPSSPFLAPIKESWRFKPSNLYLGVQNIHHKEAGAFTGEVSVEQIKGLVKYAIIGHSERILYFGETEAQTKAKLKLAFASRVIPILAVGEMRKSPASGANLARKLGRLVQGLSSRQKEQMVVAYEPVWAIGSGKSATGALANDICARLARVMTPLTRFVYGGSVSSRNVDEFVRQESIDGVLVGGASLRAGEFLKLIKRTVRVYDDSKVTG